MYFLCFAIPPRVAETNKGSEVLSQITLIKVSVISLNISVHKSCTLIYLHSSKLYALRSLGLLLLIDYSKNIYCVSLNICMGFISL